MIINSLYTTHNNTDPFSRKLPGFAVNKIQNLNFSLSNQNVLALTSKEDKVMK